ASFGRSEDAERPHFALIVYTIKAKCGRSASSLLPKEAGPIEDHVMLSGRTLRRRTQMRLEQTARRAGACR
ncbi:hypothetical protein AMR77_25880, partial [Escherichia coli]